MHKGSQAQFSELLFSLKALKLTFIVFEMLALSYLRKLNSCAIQKVKVQQMINKNSKQLIKRYNNQPQAIGILRGLSQHEESQCNLSSFKFPYCTIERNYEEEDIADWSKLRKPFLASENSQPGAFKSNFKTIFKEQKENKKYRRSNLYLSTFTNGSFAQKTSKNSVSASDKLKIYHQSKEKPRCALKNIIPDFCQAQKSKQSLQHLNSKKWPSIAGRQPIVFQQKGCLAIRKIKKQMLNGLETRSKLLYGSGNSLQNNKKKNKLCSQINLRLSLQTDQSNRKENTPKNQRVVSWHNYIRMRCHTIEKCFDVQREGNLTNKSKHDAIQYKLLKNLLYKEKM